MAKHRVLSIVGSLAFLFVGFTWAQVPTATISGAVEDSTGAGLPGATVVILNEGTGISRTVRADAEGRYLALSLSLGNYRVTASQSGFQTEVRSGIVLTVGQEARVDMLLALGAETQTVTVTGAAPLLESTTASLGSLVAGRTIRTLPLNGRSYNSLALLQPGVILTDPGHNAGPPFGFGAAVRYSVGGQRPNANLFLLDGTNIVDQTNSTPGGAAGTLLGVDTIQEFKIYTSSWNAEFGHSNGSIVTAVTRSGTNSLHGTAFEYIRNSVLDSMNYFDRGSSPPPFRRNQFGGLLGGPIKRDKSFFFVGYEGLRQALGTTQTATVPTALARQGILPTGTVTVNPVVVPFLNLYPLPNGRDFGDGTAQFLSAPTAPTNEDYFMVRMDHQLNAKNSIFGRYVFDTDSTSATQALPDSVVVAADRRQYATVQLTSFLGRELLNDARFAFNRSKNFSNQLLVPDPGPQFAIIPGQPFGAIQIGAAQTAVSPLTPLGVHSGNGIAPWAFNTFETADDLSYVTGKHTLKTGVDVQRTQGNAATGSSLRGQYTFASLSTFLAGTPSDLSAGSPLGVNPNWGLRQTLYGVYGQDDYRVNSRLTLNLGLRWEITTDPIDVNGKMAILPSLSATATVPSDKFLSIGKKNFEPRFGLAWQPNDAGKTVLRLGAGIYHNQILPWAYEQQIALPPFFGQLDAKNPPFPDGYTVLAAPGLIQMREMEPVEKTPTMYQYNLSIQQQLFKDTMLQVSYAGTRANHLETVTEADTTIPTFCSTSLNNCPAGIADGEVYYPANTPRVNPAWKGNRFTFMGGNSTYNAGTVTLRHQSSSGFLAQIFYTYSNSMDSASSYSVGESLRSPSPPEDPYHPERNWARSDWDVRHAAVANFVYPLPFRPDSKALAAVVGGWTFGGIATFTAGAPFTARLTTGVSRDQASVLAERPNLIPGHSPNPTHGVSAGCPGFAAGTPVGDARNWFDPCSFSLPLAGTYGDLARNTLTGPGLADVDLSLEKNVKLHEKVNVTFRTDVFNIMNHPNLGLPNGNALATGGAANPSAGVITYTTTSSRQIQFAVRIGF